MVLHEALHNVCKYARFLVFVELLVIKTQCAVVPSVIPSPLWVVMVAQVSMVGKGRALDDFHGPKVDYFAPFLVETPTQTMIETTMKWLGNGCCTSMVTFYGHTRHL